MALNGGRVSARLGKRLGFDKLRDVLRREPVRFAVVFAIIVALIFGINSLVVPTRFMKRYIEIIAASVALVLRISPFEVGLEGSLIRFHEFAVRIIPECSGVEAMAIFCGAVIAFPATIRKKLLAVGVGVPALYVVNILRLACLAYIGAFKSREVFDFAHVYVWQTVFIIFVVILWLIWIEKIVKKREPEQGEKAADSQPGPDDVAQ
jgi:exosortase H (IPTLxxWG-CTERM-specific)